MATQTLVFLFADTWGPAAMSQRPSNAYARVAAGYRRLIRAGRAGHGR